MALTYFAVHHHPVFVGCETSSDWSLLAKDARLRQLAKTAFNAATDAELSTEDYENAVLVLFS